MRRYAEETEVPVSRSRGEIDKLLREWGATGVQWTDDWHQGRVALKFVWHSDGGKTYLARFSITLPTDDVLRERARWGGRPGAEVQQGKLERLVAGRGRQEHRLLALWLKAALNAVHSGMVSAEAIFLPFLEGRDGKTVYEVAGAKLDKLNQGPAVALLTDGR